MRVLRHSVGTAAMLAGVPVLVLLVLATGGALRWGLAVAGIGVVAVGAVLLALLWVRDLNLVLHALRLPEPGLRDGPPAPAPRFSAIARIAREADRLSRATAADLAQARATVQAEQSLIRLLPDPVVVLGPAHAVRRRNEAAASTFGPAIGAVLRHPDLRAAIDRALAEGHRQSADLTLPVPVSREVSATVIPLPAPLADGGRLVAVLSDRTRERAVERMRADFVANASHELRTPLASLIGFIDTLRGPAADDPPAQARFLGIMAEQAERMNRLIDDLLSLSRIELTEHQVPADRLELQPLIRRLAAAFELRMRDRRQRLEVHAPPGLPPITGDEDQLEQVLQNLLDNAVKYGRPGGTLRLEVQEAPPGTPWPARQGVTITVADDGPGIARAHIPRLTERFYRADKQGSRQAGGTGLGLAIVKHIVNRHRGQLAIDSTEGVGTSVTVWLPAELPRPLAPAAADDGAAKA
jgi:two-component system phosphate regulon sensor histidine kinase PhoR